MQSCVTWRLQRVAGMRGGGIPDEAVMASDLIDC